MYLSLSRIVFVLFSCLMLSLFNPAWANDPPSPDMPEKLYQLSVSNPERDVGYIVGDKLARHIVLKVNQPYQLIETSLPIVGYERRYQGQIIGIELRNIQYSKQKFDQYMQYTIDLQYQVFDNEATAKMFFLPKEVLKFQGTKSDDIVQIEVPSWGFRVSPLSIFGAVKIEQDMSGFHPLFLIASYPEKQKLAFSLSLLGISLIGLVYILGNRAWLPNMGRPFAKTYRQLRKLSHDETQLESALSLLHKALNEAGQTSIFSDNLDVLYQRIPALKNIEGEIQTFFAISRKVLYENQISQLDAPATMQWLKQFCVHCRDCERGLKPVA